MTFQQPTWTYSHWFSDARRDQSINQTFTCHLFRSQAHVSQQTKDGFDNHACFDSYYILLNIIYHILYAIYHVLSTNILIYQHTNVLIYLYTNILMYSYTIDKYTNIQVYQYTNILMY